MQDSAKDLSGIGKEEAGHIGNDTNNLDCSKNRDLDLDHDRDVDCCARANADEPSADSLEEDVKSSEISSGLRRLVYDTLVLPFTTSSICHIVFITPDA